MIGVLGGMGPLATVEFMRKVILKSSATGDAGCVPMLVVADGRIPDRSAAIMDRDAISPLADMMRCANALTLPAVDLIVIPCNTAHNWIEELAQATQKPILSMVDLAAKEADILARRCGSKKIGLLGTRGLMAAQLYQNALRQLGDWSCELLQESDQRLLDSTIAAVKCADMGRAQDLGAKLTARIQQSDAKVWIVGCTELPIALADRPRAANIFLVDATETLSSAVVDAYRAKTTGEARARLARATALENT